MSTLPRRRTMFRFWKRRSNRLGMIHAVRYAVHASSYRRMWRAVLRPFLDSKYISPKPRKRPNKWCNGGFI